MGKKLKRDELLKRERTLSQIKLMNVINETYNETTVIAALTENNNNNSSSI